MTVRHIATAATACALAAGTTHAATVNITSLIQEGNALSIQSGMFNATVLDNAAPGFTTMDLRNIHEELNSAGVSTDGFVSFLAAETAQGLTMFALIDRQINMGGDSGMNLSYIELSTVVDTMGAQGWINDSDSDNYDDNVITNSFEVAYEWSDSNSGDAFAWSGLTEGDSGSFSFANYMGDGVDSGFQFVTWTDNGWTVVDNFDIPDDVNQSVDFVVIPLPTPVGLATAGLAGAGLLVRRRTMR